ncbi:hypothetical protein [Reichenbachiella versicolor]|uniref:hypothetical protein n=1 Tax=Reichenbachiella versicolor TaxID=1821036 RepID=UPI000D6DE0F9|nr:hypothetical protein [Reichenbachiella versicolor]
MDLELDKIINNLRDRLTEYRIHTKSKKASIHVNAVEIALCLAEFSAIDNRQIKESERAWFTAGVYLEYTFGGTEWEDINDLYFQLKKSLIKQGHMKR